MRLEPFRFALFALVLLVPRVGAAAQTAPAAMDGTARARFVLERVGFGPRPGDLARVRSMGAVEWLDRQLQPERIDDPALAGRLSHQDVLSLPTAELFRRYPNPMAVRRAGAGADAAADPQAARRERARIHREQGYGRPQEIYRALVADRLLRAVYSERQLQEAMVDFWSNHFNVYARKGVENWYLPAFDREVIRPHALGNFRELLRATARSPAMLFYLDNLQSVAPGMDGARAAKLARLDDSQLRDVLMRRRHLDAGAADTIVAKLRAAASKQGSRGLNENYARELMELHTLGVNGGYTQDDVREVARAFTGWTVADPRGLRAVAEGADPTGRRAAGDTGQFVFDARRHDGGIKTVLGHPIDAGGEGDGVQVLDLLARQPATARFIARKLAVKFVSDAPPPALVERVAQAFLRSDGDIRATLRALFHDPLFFDPANARAKIKTPFELVASSLRALQADTDGMRIQAFLADLGEPLYGHQAPDGYPDTAQAWVNSGALLKRMNFATALAGNRIPGTEVDLSVLKAGGREPMLDDAVSKWLGGAVSDTTRLALRQQLEATATQATEPVDPDDDDLPMGEGKHARTLRLRPATGDPMRVRLAALLLGSPDFQRQ